MSADVLSGFIREQLRHVSLFATVASENFTRVAQLFEFKEVSPEATLCTQGELGTSFFVLLAGHVGIFKDCTHVKTVACEGDARELLPVFGESALIKFNQQREATVIAESACQILVCRSNHFKELLRLMPRLKQHLLDISLAQNRQTEVLRDLKLDQKVSTSRT